MCRGLAAVSSAPLSTSSCEAMALQLLPLLLAKPPVVMVPGIAASVFRARLTGTARPPHFWCRRSADWATVWMQITQLLPEQKDCLMFHLASTFNATDGTYHDAPGVELDTNVDFGGVGGIAYVDPSVHMGWSSYFLPMISSFEAQGYTVGVDLHGAPFDWRAAPDGHRAPGMYYERLQRLVEATVRRNGAKAAIITHSLGGVTALAFLNSRPAGWVSQYVESFIPISAPWGGATMMALSDVSGTNMGFNFLPYDYFKPMQTSIASGVFVLPTRGAFGNRTIVSAGGKNYTASDMRLLLEQLGLTQSLQILDNLERLQLNVDDLTPPAVRTLVITSKGVKTAETYSYSDPLSVGFNEVPAHTVYGDGDGTINLVSLRLAQNGGWPTDDGVERLFFEVEGVEHSVMVKNQQVLGAIDAFLKRNQSVGK